MKAIILIQNDLRQIMRDPIMAILIFAPLLLIVVFKLLLIFLIPFIQNRTGFDISPYLPYVLIFVIMMSGAMLGIVTAFMMIDERDGKIAELMAVTPLGRAGYLINRLFLASVLTVFYGHMAYVVLDVIALPILSVLFVSCLSAIYAIIIGLLIFSFADDKVKGLTFAKAVNSLSLFAFSDLLAIRWLTILSWFFPPYWIAMIVKSPYHFNYYLLALLIHFVWLVLLIRHYWRRENQ